MAVAADPVGRMSPDTAEVRLARLDEALKNYTNRLEAMSEGDAPTNRQVIENALQLSELKQDLKELSDEVVKQVERRERELHEIETKVLTLGHSIGEMERRWEKQRAAFDRSLEALDLKWERERVAQEKRDRETREALERKAIEDRRTRNRWIIGIICAFLTAFGAVYFGTVLG